MGLELKYFLSQDENPSKLCHECVESHKNSVSHICGTGLRPSSRFPVVYYTLP